MGGASCRRSKHKAVTTATLRMLQMQCCLPLGPTKMLWLLQGMQRGASPPLSSRRLALTMQTRVRESRTFPLHSMSSCHGKHQTNVSFRVYPKEHALIICIFANLKANFLKWICHQICDPSHFLHSPSVSGKALNT